VRPPPPPPSTFSTLVLEKTPTSVKHLTEGKTGALLATYANGVKAIVKPAKRKLPNGKTTQRGISVGSHPRREVAFYQLSKLLGFNIVPETVLTTKAVPGVEASVQVFMPAYHLKQFNPKLSDVHNKGWKTTLIKTALRVSKDQWRQLLALDIIAGARDRHANNVGVTMHIEDNRPIYNLVAWDNAATFGLTFARYHNVFHKYLFRQSVNFDKIWPVLDKITLKDLRRTLGPYVSEEEVGHAFMRMEFFQEYPYKLPWRVASDGNDGPSDFPDYKAFFEPVVEKAQHLVVLGR